MVLMMHVIVVLVDDVKVGDGVARGGEECDGGRVGSGGGVGGGGGSEGLQQLLPATSSGSDWRMLAINIENKLQQFIPLSEVVKI